MIEGYTERYPYIVDPHCHLRVDQPRKEGTLSGTRAGLIGGTTVQIDMPNNGRGPKEFGLIDSLPILRRKALRASKQTVNDLRFYAGTIGDPNQNFEEIAPYVLGLKAFFHKSTNGYVVPLELAPGVFKRWPDKTKPILVHVEEPKELELAINLASDNDNILYVCHANESWQLKLLEKAKTDRPDQVFIESTLHHFLIDDWRAADPYFQVRPLLREPYEVGAMRDAVVGGLVDVIGTDHAPHSDKDKEAGNCFGMTGAGLQFPLLLMGQRRGIIDKPRIIDLTHNNPIRIFNLPEEPFEQNYVVIRRDVPHIIRGRDLPSKAATPYEGWRVYDWVEEVVWLDQKRVEDGKIIMKPGSGRVLPEELVAA